MTDCSGKNVKPDSYIQLFYPSRMIRIPKSYIQREGADFSTMQTDQRDPVSGCGEENEERKRSEFMRDRDRILYSSAFRRLAGKTQIYTNGSDDHKQNRLTHTLEVAQIAKSIAKGLDLDEDLAEAIALGHDLGHTPFGHAGEELLHIIMIPGTQNPVRCTICDTDEEDLKKAWNNYFNDAEPPYSSDALFGFKHNLQSVRVASTLEDSYWDDDGKNLGLNLTNYTLWGIMNHSKTIYNDSLLSKKQPNYQNQYNESLAIFPTGPEAWSFEAHVVEMADDIAQWHHDLEDALRSGCISKRAIVESIKNALFSDPDGEKTVQLKKLEAASDSPLLTRNFLAMLAHVVVDRLVTDLINTSRENLAIIFGKMEQIGKSASDLYNNYEDVIKECGLQSSFESHEMVISFSPSLKTYLIKEQISQVHHSREVERMNSKGRSVIKSLFQAYYDEPQELIDGAIYQILIEFKVKGYKNIQQALTKTVSEARCDFSMILQKRNDNTDEATVLNLIIMRRICDHIASMTDRYALEEYHNLFD